MRGLVLEGGGAKGAFHVGAINAFAEHGIDFDGVMGTSIGAINGAMVAQGNLELLNELWNNAMPSMLFDVDDDKVGRLINRQLDRDTLGYFVKLLRSTISNRGFSTEKALNLLRKYIDEEQVRRSHMDFGVVTISITDNFTAMEIFKEEMPEGTLHDYIMASAYYPAFKMQPLNGKKYFDGGLFDNMPINPLIRRGYSQIYAIRTMSNMPHRRVVDPTVSVQYINASEPLGNTISFTQEIIQKNIKLGYYDSNRVLNGWMGGYFYFKPLSAVAIRSLLAEFLGDAQRDKIALLLGLPQSADISAIFAATVRFASKIVPSENLSDAEIFIRFVEKYATKLGLLKFLVYDFCDFLALARDAFAGGAHASKPLPIIDRLRNMSPSRRLESLFAAYMQAPQP